MKTPFFSIIVPVYKVNNTFLRECIDSVLAQSFGNFELILVDDGSPDNCGQVCDDYAKQDERVRVIHQVNQGVSAARNTGISHASGEWIMFVDADDWIKLDACEVIYDRIREHDCEILKFGAISETTEGSRVMNYEFEDGRVYNLNIPNEREYIYHCIMHVPDSSKIIKNLAYYSWDKVYKKSFIVNHNIKFPIGLARSEDKIFILSCVQYITKLYCVEDKLYHYRINDESVCQRYSKNVDKDRIKLSRILETKAREMNEELALLFNEPSYNNIMEDYERFVFGLITDVLYLKFYHKDNPEYKNRKKDAIMFLNTEPFCSVVYNIPYSKLSIYSKIKKFCLKNGWISLFCYSSLKYRNYYKKILSRRKKR